MHEHWKAVVGYEGFYECSDRGRVRSLDRVVDHKYGPLHLKGLVLHQRKDDRGYVHVSLCKSGAQKSYRVHVLIAEAWLPKSLNQQILHGEKGIDDNSVSNLSRGTQSENILQSYRRDRTRVTRSVIRSDGWIYPSIIEAAEDIGVSHSAIWRVCNNYMKSAGGYSWSYYTGN